MSKAGMQQQINAQLAAAVSRHQRGEFAAASVLYEQVLRLDPRNVAALSNLGLARHELGQYEAALALFDRALVVKRSHPEAHYNRGNTLRELGRLDEAIASYDKALSLRPQFVEPLVNRARTHRDLNQIDKALADYERAIRLAPDLPAAQLNCALTRLVAGDFVGGLPQFEWRWRDAQLKDAARQLDKPLWLGDESPSGKTLLLHAEQGLGDSIQFVRYASLLRDRGARVLLEVQPPLATLLSRVDGVAQVIERGQPLPAFDLHCPLLSLPLACRTALETIPASPAYLHADPARVRHWQQRLEGMANPRIGLIWSGSTGHKNDRNRSLPLAALAALLESGPSFVSLQKEVRAPDQEMLGRESRLRHFGDALRDFDDTAAVAMCLDLVISVDTAGAHLAAALGRPVWLLLPYSPDWRWLLGRPDSPWYPSVRLIRQRAPGDWSGVLADVGQRLAALR